MTKTHFDIEYLRRYVQGDLSTSEMHRIERAAHEDEMLMDIINGLEFEFLNNLPDNKQEIKKAILSRSQQSKTTSTRKLPLRSLSIAASLTFLLGIGAVLFFKDNKIKEKEQLVTLADETPVEAEVSIPEVFIQTDSATPLNYGTNERIGFNKNNAAASSKSPLHEDTKRIASIDQLPTTKNIDLNAQVSRNGNQLTIIAEEVIITNNPNFRDEKIINGNEQLLLKDAKATLSSVNKSESIVLQRAKLSRMNLDPQTQRTLSEALDRQEREQTKKEIATVNRVGEGAYIDSSATNALAFRQDKTLTKTNNSEDGYLAEVTMVSSSKKREASVPINGIDKYKNNLIFELSKITTEPFNFKIEFRLNKDGLPEKIKFLSSSNPALENIITNYLETKELWIPGKDAKKIILEIKQVKK